MSDPTDEEMINPTDEEMINPTDEEMINQASRNAARAVAHNLNEQTLALAFKGLIMAAQAAAIGVVIAAEKAVDR